MASEMATQFMRTLQLIEKQRDPEPLVALFADDGEASNLGHKEPMRGRDGVRQFWQNYLNVFGEIRSDFNHVIEGEGGILLEWVSEGTLADGTPIRYLGVSVLETDGERVQRFRTYYDSAAFLPQGSKTSQGGGEK